MREHFTQNIPMWKAYFDSTEPQTFPLPDYWETQLNSLEKLDVLRCLRPDKLVTAIQLFVMSE